MIPKIIHYVWIGPKKLPRTMQEYVSGWKKLHPKFEFMLWNDRNIDFSIPYLKAARRYKKWANISNLVRLMALREHGGIYLDTDVKVLRPFDPLLGNECFLGFQVKKKQAEWVNNAVFGATKNHWFVSAMERSLLKKFDGCEEAHFSSPFLTTALLTKFGLKRYSERSVKVEDIQIFPTRYFYPYTWYEKFTKDCITPDTFAVHHWAKSWMVKPKDIK